MVLNLPADYPALYRELLTDRLEARYRDYTAALSRPV